MLLSSNVLDTAWLIPRLTSEILNQHTGILNQVVATDSNSRVIAEEKNALFSEKGNFYEEFKVYQTN